jgi:hypothetical protein
MFQGPLPILYMCYSRAHLVSEQFGPRAGKQDVPGPTACSYVLFQGPLGERAVRTDGQGRERRNELFQGPLPILYMCYSRVHLVSEERYVPGPIAYILHALFQGTLGERAVRTKGQGRERRNGMFQGPLLIFYMRYSRAHLVSEQFGPTDKGESGRWDIPGPTDFSTCIIPGPTW